MGGLQRFENRLEELISGAFARAFRSAVQPVEISAALHGLPHWAGDGDGISIDTMNALARAMPTQPTAATLTRRRKHRSLVRVGDRAVSVYVATLHLDEAQQLDVATAIARELNWVRAILTA